MRRVIYATKADDLKREQAKYDAELHELESKHNEQTANWRSAGREIEKQVQDDVREVIGPTSLNLQIRAEQGWNDMGYRVTVQADDAQSLRWNMDVNLDKEGKVIKKTGSWSGLKATTFEEIDELKESVRIIEKLNGINWPALLFREGPDWDEYVDQDLARNLFDKKQNRPNYEADIATAELEDLIGTDMWIKLEGSPTDQFGYRDYRYTYWAKIKKATPAQFVVDLCNTPGNTWSNEYRVKKSNFIDHMTKPMETAKEGADVQ